MLSVANSPHWVEGPIVAVEGEQCVKDQLQWRSEWVDVQSGSWWWFGRVGVCWKIGWLEELQSIEWF